MEAFKSKKEAEKPYLTLLGLSDDAVYFLRKTGVTSWLDH